MRALHLAVGRGRTAALHEVIGGRRWRISARSFFQPGPESAEAISATVADSVVDGLSDRGVVVDLYGGGGLLSGIVFDHAAAAGRVGVEGVLVERSGPSVDDARHNLDGLSVEVVASPVEDWTPRRAQVVVADPARDGVSKRAMRVLLGCEAERVVLVSCDAAAAGRDIGRLVEAGYAHHRSTVIDAFPQTHHVEVVTTLDRR